MFELTLFGALVALAWLGRRYWLLSKGVRLLANSLEQRRPFLSESERLPRIHRSWKKLAGEATRLVYELNRLNQLRTGHLTQLETALRSLQEGVMIVDDGNCIMLANNAMSAIYPSIPVLLGQRVEVVLRSAEFLEFLEEVRQGRGAPRREIELFSSGGSIWVEATGTSVPGTDGENGPWTLFVFHDVTRQKRLEAVRREFVANVSHELKTPLSIIKGYAETLVDDHAAMSDADRTQFIRAIHRHSERLAAILEDLLVLSRLESSNPGIQLSEVRVASFLRSVHDDYVGTLAESKHTLELAVTRAGDARAKADAQRLTQVLANLIDNARKYTPPGTRIEIGARANPTDRSMEIWVHDNGPGIPAADLPHIFERFYRVEKGRSREKGGTGLGLSIVKHIIQLHGGNVWAESKSGEGTRIAFRLPLAAEDAGTTEMRTLAVDAPERQ